MHVCIFFHNYISYECIQHYNSRFKQLIIFRFRLVFNERKGQFVSNLKLVKLVVAHMSLVVSSFEKLSS